MQWHAGRLWLTSAGESVVIRYDPVGESCDEVLSLPGVRHACPSDEGVWLITGGGRLGQQLVLWSPETNRVIRRFDCPDGAASGATVLNDKLWLSHRRNRKLFCMDPEKGRNLWTIRMEHQVFSPTSCGDELWCVECDPGPLGDWSDERQAAYAFLRYDAVRVSRSWSAFSVPYPPGVSGLEQARRVLVCPGRRNRDSLAEQAGPLGPCSSFPRNSLCRKSTPLPAWIPAFV